jgi:hypothetical protein
LSVVQSGDRAQFTILLSKCGADRTMNPQMPIASAVGGAGAPIAHASSVETHVSHRVDLVHSAEPDEWAVTVDGERVMAFSGPSAWTKALSHRAELDGRLALARERHSEDR